MTERENLMKRMMEQRFAAFETALFLDTHPKNKEALEAFKKYRQNAKALSAEYEQKFGMLTLSSDSDCEDWCWINDPWPWQ